MYRKSKAVSFLKFFASVACDFTYKGGFSAFRFTEESYQCSRDSDSDSFSDIEPDDENYEAISSTK